MNPKIRRKMLTETYIDMKGFISGTAYRFWIIYGGDLDDLKSQANLIFINAVDDFDSSKGTKLSTWIVYKIQKRLLDYMRNGYLPTHTSIDELFDEIESKPNENFSVMELLDELEQDAHIVLQLFLDTPREVILNIFEDKNFRLDHTGGKVRNRLRNRLRQMGWTIKRIRKAFEEIKSVTSY